jgi:5-methyltetrahydrofolate--homocysteine methyltransferase
MGASAIDELIQSIVDGDIEKAAASTRQALEAGTPAKQILDTGLVPAMEQVGEGFASGELFFPELLVAGEAAKAALDQLKPELSRKAGSYVGKCAIGTVQGDVHDIGKNIVVMMLEANGWQVTDLGIDVAPRRFCEVVATGEVQLLGIGAYLTSTAPKLAETIQALSSAGLRDRVKVMVGGVPVTQLLADRIGADAYSATAVEAVATARSLLVK